MVEEGVAGVCSAVGAPETLVRLGLRAHTPTCSAASVIGQPSLHPPTQTEAYTLPSGRLLLQTTSTVTSRVTRMGTTMKGQRTLLGGSCKALPETGQFLK